MTKKGSNWTEFDEIIVKGYFRQALDENDCVKLKDGEVKIEGLATKSR